MKEMKKKIGSKVISLTLLTALFITGCGTVTSGDSTEARGNTVSGSAVHEAGTVEKKEEPSYFGNSSNYYLILSEFVYELSGHNKDGIVQFRNDGTKVGVVEIKNIERICYVDDDGVYYTKSHGDMCQLCYLPVIKEAGEDKPLEKKKEEVLLEEDWSDPEEFYCEDEIVDLKVNSEYFFYTNPKQEYVRYNRKTKKKTVESPLGKTSWEDVTVLGTFGNKVLLGCSNDEKSILCSQNLDTMKWEILHEEKSWITFETEYNRAITQNGEVLFYATAYPGYADNLPDIRGYDSRANREELLCTGAEIEKGLKKEGLVEDKNSEFNFIIGDAFCGPENRLYLQLQVIEENDTIYETRHVIFSIGMEEKTLVYEKELCEAIWQNSVYERALWKNHLDINCKTSPITYRQNAGQCITIIGDRAILILSQPEDKSQFAYFDLTEGKFQKFSRKSKEFLEMQRCEDPLTYYWYRWTKGGISLYHFPKQADMTDWKYEK
ncbi:MAG: hypothetical protein J1F22_05110 [Lachnospiraceae bacterium]|nr:hypothetical protein [Lachnospiraceae bacterium]